jgi:hypothetical protein
LKKLVFLSLLMFYGVVSFAQFEQSRGTRPLNAPQTPNKQENSGTEDLDSLRKNLDAKKDSVVYNATYIKFTKEEFLRDSTRLFPLDTTTNGFHRYRVLDQPENPSINLGLNGLAYRDMLFNPEKRVLPLCLLPFPFKKECSLLPPDEELKELLEEDLLRKLPPEGILEQTNKGFGRGNFFFSWKIFRHSILYTDRLKIRKFISY